MPARSATQCTTCPSCCCPDAVLHTNMSVGSQQLSASNGQAGADSSTLQSLAGSGGGGKESLSDKVKHPFHHGQSLCCRSMMQHQVNWCCSSATSQHHQPAAAAAARGYKAPSNACVLGVCSHCAAGAAAAAQPVRNMPRSSWPPGSYNGAAGSQCAQEEAEPVWPYPPRSPTMCVSNLF